jgi:voltage-gated potassium channel
VTLFFSTVFFFAYNIRIFELPYFRLENDESIKNVFDSYFNSIYFAIITITTVGYGDIPVCTYPGRLIVIFLAVWGSFMMSLMVVTVQ